MKKLLALLIVLAMMLAAVAACGPGDDPESTPTPPTDTDTDADNDSDSDNDTDTGSDGDTGDDSDSGNDTGADSGSDGDVDINSSVEVLIAQVFANLDDSFELPMFMNTPLSNDMEYGESGIAYYIGTHDVPITEGVASEPAVGAIPLSVCLVRVEQGTDVEAAMTLIRDNAPTDKWICVWADTVIVERIGDLVILIMTNEEDRPGLGEALKQAFLAMTP